LPFDFYQLSTEYALTNPTYEPERFRSPAYLAVVDDAAAQEKFSINQDCLDKMAREAEAGYPLEICGLLAGTIGANGWHVTEAHAVTNLNTDRAADRFQLDPAGYQAVDRALRGSGREIIGVYHSHPDCPARPSPTDLDSAWEGFAYPIISVCDQQVADIRCWCLNDAGDRFSPVSINSESV